MAVGGCGGGRGGRVRVLRMISMDKILLFTNTISSSSKAQLLTGGGGGSVGRYASECPPTEPRVYSESVRMRNTSCNWAS